MPRSKFSRIADEHHVARRCGYQVIERDALSNEVVGLYPTAMKLRQEINETYLSVNWLEHCSGAKIERLRIVIAIHRAKAKTRLSPHSGVAVLNAGRIGEIGIGHGHRLAIRSTPSKDDASYSRVSGLPLDNSDELLIASLADEAYKDFVLLGDIDAPASANQGSGAHTHRP
jgi:hypothetical protein